MPVGVDLAIDYPLAELLDESALAYAGGGR